MRLRYVLRLAAALFVLFPLAAFAQEADLAISKDGPPVAAAGANVAYTITLLNIGPDDSTGPTISDNIPPGMTFVSLTQDSGTAVFSCSTPSVGTNGTVDCSAGLLAAGDSASFTLTVQIDPLTAPGTAFTNIATTSSETFDPNDENNSATAVTSTPSNDADMVVVKNGPGGAAPGGDVTYTITLTNAGPSDATNVALNDTLPGDMTFVSLVQNNGPTMSCSTPAIGTGGTVTCTIATFPNGATATFTLVTNVPLSSPSGTSYDNTATVTSDNDPTSENNISSTTLVVSAVDLSVVKNAPITATAGGSLAYSLTISNAGPDTAINTMLFDTLPTGTRFVSFVNNSGPAGICSTPLIGNPGSINCLWSSFGAGASSNYTLTVTIDPTVADGTVLANTANVSSDSNDTNGTNNNSTAFTTVTGIADLAVTKTGPATIDAGSNITYTITVANTGGLGAASTQVSDVLPANTTFVSATPSQGSCANAAGTVTCTLGTVAAGGNVTITLVATVNSSASGSLANTATATTSTTEPNLANNSSTANTTITSSADVSITKNGPAIANDGAPITYTIVASNAGPSDAANVTVTDALPANETFVSLNQAGAVFSCTTPTAGTNGTVTCTAATLASGASTTFTLNVQTVAGSPGSTSNTATIATTTTDPNTANNSSTAVTNVASPDVSITKTTTSTTTTVGAPITYTITVTNSSAVQADAVTVTDVLPANTTFVSATPSQGTCSNAAGTVTCSMGTLAPNSNATISLVITATAQGSVTNSASVTSTSGDSNPGNNSSTAPAVVVGAGTNVPTVSPLMLALLGMALAFAAVTVLRS